MRRTPLVLAIAALCACSTDAPPVDAGADGDCPRIALQGVDLLLVVDDSASMAEEHAELAARLPHFVAQLTSGDLDGDGAPDVAPVRDLHLGVVTADMGVLGTPGVPTCTRDPAFGDDAVLRDAPRSAGAGCAATYPHFLRFAGCADPAAVAADFVCLARVGETGCGFEQPLDAALKATLPASSPVPFFRGTHGHGDDVATNAGFLRPAALLVVLVLTDADDCSTGTPGFFDPAVTTYDGEWSHRCINHPDALHPVSRFVDGLRSLQPGAPETLLFVALTGAPPELVVPDATGAVDYDALLADPRMQNREVMVGTGLAIGAACTSSRGDAAPGIRLARVAQALGRDGMLRSICTPTFEPALDDVAREVGSRVGHPSSYCAPTPL